MTDRTVITSTDLPSPVFDSRYFRDALAQFATGVTVIAVRGADNALIGLTATSFNSVSLTPPLVLWSLAVRASSLPQFENASHYVINVLSAGQQALAQRFARRVDGGFDGLAQTLSPRGLPILDGAAAWFECRNRSRYLEGDHWIFVGEVEHCGVNPQAPLIFHGGQFLAGMPITI